jgi:excisionase family DNA binding protein
VKTPADQLLTYNEVADLGNVSIRTVRRLVATRTLRALFINCRVVRVPLSEWNRYRESLAAQSHETSLNQIVGTTPPTQRSTN